MSNSNSNVTNINAENARNANARNANANANANAENANSANANAAIDLPQSQEAPEQFKGTIPEPIPVTVPSFTVPSPGAESESYSNAYKASYDGCYKSTYKNAYTTAFNEFVAPQKGYRTTIPDANSSQDKEDKEGAEGAEGAEGTEGTEGAEGAEPNDDSIVNNSQQGGYSHDTVEPDPIDTREPEDELVEPPLEDFM